MKIYQQSIKNFLQRVKFSHSNDDGVMEPVAKKSKDKTSVGGRKWALRRRNTRGIAEAEIIGIGEAPHDDGDDRPLMVDLVRDGAVIADTSVQAARERHHASREELPASARQLQKGEPVIPTVYLGGAS